MNQSSLNFAMISKALSVSMDALRHAQGPKESAMQKLISAHKEMHQALSFASGVNTK
ncbi:hypothetical protein RCG23_20710 [Neobacillus sp. PS3-34]|uniref:hypothetical protein n=1 Tax=Neobacillus sp. PS3-34 TaxID=3070678 RepID=UPI0027DED883|nr:hypothetical protein [Neobacillus sp. PS3-34]WML47740.1 hypothetical protein RCG23_20710 [Neobacillus sp. PS3-34]